MTYKIFKTDDTDAHGLHFLDIVVSNPKCRPMSKIIFSINKGQIQINFTDEEMHFAQEEFTLSVDLTSAQTAQLKAHNTGHLVTYDMNNKQKTCKGFYEFDAIDGVLTNGRNNG